MNFQNEKMANIKSGQYETTIEMLPDEILNMIFNMINFHGHLRLSGVCTRWNNLVRNDVLFMNTVRFGGFCGYSVGEMDDYQTLMRSYKHLDFCYDHPWKIVLGENLQTILKTVETIDFNYTTKFNANLIIPLCPNLKEVRLTGFQDPDHCDAMGESDDKELTFHHPLPVKIPKTSSTEFLDRFDVITEISQFDSHTVPSEQVMAKYGGIIKSLSISFKGSLDGCDRFDKLQLQHLCLSRYRSRLLERDYSTGQDKVITVQSFFNQQAQYLKTIEIKYDTGFVFDPMRMLLKNLEKIKMYSTHSEPCLNDLRVLPKLKCLEYVTRNARHNEYHLDVVDLANLSELCIACDHYPASKLRIILPNQPLDAMEKMKIGGFKLDIKSLKQIVQTMPRLREFECGSSFREGADFSLAAAAEFNKLTDLESIKETNLRFLNNNFLGKLSLSKLRHLVLLEHSKTNCNNRRTRITTLDKLAKNCPKLTRLFGTHLYTGHPFPFIFAQRADATSKFRIVRQVRNKVNDGRRLRFDYDSVESCPSDED